MDYTITEIHLFCSCAEDPRNSQADRVISFSLCKLINMQWSTWQVKIQLVLKKKPEKKHKTTTTTKRKHGNCCIKVIK